MRLSLLPVYAAMFCIALLTGCYVPNKLYRKTPDSFIQVPTAPKLPINKPLPDGPACTRESLSQKPCLVFLEFDDMGEQWTNTNSNYTTAVPAGWCSHDGKPCQQCASQLCNAIAIVREATSQSIANNSQAIIVTFTHGWKHNAGEGDSNIEGFKQALNDLRRVYQNRIVVGVFISWRGNLVSGNLPVRQQFTYFNREAAAIRIPGASVTDALIRIADAAHNQAPTNSRNRPFVVFVGHSFGALFMERSLSQAMVRQIDTDGGLNNYHPIADMFVLVNSAAAATEAKETLDFLAENKLEYPKSDAPGAPDRPLILSVSSSSDLATRVAVPVGHALPWLGYKLHGSFRGSDDPNYSLMCYSGSGDSHPIQPTPAQSSFFLSTAPHMEILQSHQVVRTDCSAPEGYPGYVFRYVLPDTDMPDKKPVCFDVKEKVNRCNGTPYWLMEIDPSIVPDHSTIFTQRFIQFLIGFLPTQDEMDTGTRPRLTSKQ